MKAPIDDAPGQASESASSIESESSLTRRAILGSIGIAAGLAAAAARSNPRASIPTGCAIPIPVATELPRNSSGGAALAQGGLTYSKFKMYKMLDQDLELAPTLEFPFIPGSRFKAVNTGINEPVTQINFEDFQPGPPITWTMFHDEVQVVVSGRAEITFHLAPLMQETGVVTAEPGCVYLLPRGAHIVWRVLGNAPFRHLCVCIPNPGYPIPIARSAAEPQGLTS